MYAKSNLALLFGQFILRQNANTVSSTLNYNIYDVFYDFQPNMGMTLGFRWDKYSKRKETLISFNIAYEFQQWWNQNQMKRFLNSNPVTIRTVPRNNLSFNGFVLGTSVDF